MTRRHVKYAFTAGELAPELYGREDLERYILGAKQLHNFEVNYAGGIRRRRGMQFGEFVGSGEVATKAFSLTVSESPNDAYIVLLCPGKIRFIQNYSYLLEAPVAITGRTGTIYTSAGHGLNAGELVYLNTTNTLYRVRSATTDTFVLETLFGVAATVAATSFEKVFELDNPFAEADFSEITASQFFTELKLSHVNYPTQLIKLSGGTFTVAPEERGGATPIFQIPTITDSGAYIRYIEVTNKGSGYAIGDSISITDPTGTGFEATLTIESGEIIGVNIIDEGTGYTSPSVSITTSGGSGAAFNVGLAPTNAGYAMTVTAYTAAGESLGTMRPAVTRNSIDFTQTRGFATYSWAAIPKADYYEVFRSLVYPDGAKANIGIELGYIGTTRATNLTDNNITPDFTRSPRFYDDPFVNGAVIEVNVTAAGSGYSDNPSVTLSDPTGSGAILYPVIGGDGEVLSVIVAKGGEGYTNPTLTISGGGGSGATFDVLTSALTGNYPSTTFSFQQRAGYAGTTNNPMTIWASTLGELDNFSVGYTTDDSSPYVVTLDERQVTPIRHTVPGKNGLLIFTNSNVTLLTAPDRAAVSALNRVASPQTFVGATKVPPELVDEDLFYVQERDAGVRLLIYNQTLQAYQSQEISVLSRHLFRGKTVESLAFAYATQKRGYGVFSDGTGFSISIDRTQQVFAFSPIATKGDLKEVVSVSAGVAETMFFIVTRTIGGVTMTSFEYIDVEASARPEDAIYLDAAVTLPRNYPAAGASIDGVSGAVTLTTTSGVFTPSDVGNKVGIAGGVGYITSYIGPRQVELTLNADATIFGNESDLPKPALEGEWWMNPLVTTVSGIPLEGATVDVVADGRREPPKTVVNGQIELDFPAATVIVGLNYTAKLVTLPIPDDVAGLALNVQEAHIDVERTGPLRAGSDDMVYDVATRTFEAWAEGNKLTQNEQIVALNTGWKPNGEITVEANEPFPAEIRSVALWYVVGS